MKYVRQRKTNDIAYMQNLKINDTNELTYKIEKDSQIYKMNLWLGGWCRLGVWDDM